MKLGNPPKENIRGDIDHVVTFEGVGRHTKCNKGSYRDHLSKLWRLVISRKGKQRNILEQCNIQSENIGTFKNNATANQDQVASLS